MNGSRSLSPLSWLCHSCSKWGLGVESIGQRIFGIQIWDYSSVDIVSLWGGMGRIKGYNFLSGQFQSNYFTMYIYTYVKEKKQKKKVHIHACFQSIEHLWYTCMSKNMTKLQKVMVFIIHYNSHTQQLSHYQSFPVNRVCIFNTQTLNNFFFINLTPSWMPLI